MLTGLLIAIIGVEYLGLAATFGILRATKFSLLASLLLFGIMASRNGLGKLLSFTQVRLLLALVAMSAASISYAIVQTYVLDTVIAQVGYLIMLANVYWLIDSRKRMRILFVALTGYLSFLVVLNYDMFFQAERTGAFTAGYFMGDGNDFAWALVTFLPMVYVLYRETAHPVRRAFYFVAAGLFLTGILGSGSRGATLGLASQILFLVLISKRKVLVLTLVSIAIVGLLLFLPSTYTDRMSTIKNYEEDSSAQARLTAWKAATMMAMDHPLGVGAKNFNSAYGRYYRHKVVHEESWGSRRWISPHSIYFLTLAEYGFPGLFLLFALLISTVRANLKMHRISLQDPHPDLPDQFFLALILSLIGLSACGVFLGGVNYPHIFILIGLSIRGFHMMNDRTLSGSAAISAGTAPRSQGDRRRRTGSTPRGRRSLPGRKNRESETPTLEP